jgi:DNA polymerase III epsilon subunit-like protein
MSQEECEEDYGVATAAVTVAASVPVSVPRLVFFDLETTGLSPTARIIQFGAVEIDPTTLIERRSVSFLIGGNTPDHLQLTPTIMRITHITSAQLREQPDFLKRSDEIFKMLDGAVWGGYNIIRFDIPKVWLCLDTPPGISSKRTRSSSTNSGC